MKYCFSCMKQIRSKDFVQFNVRREFCHSSYWEHAKKEYGQLDQNKEFGTLYLHTRCAENEDECGTVLGEGYDTCNSCGMIFNNDEFSMAIYEHTGDILCAHCARDYVETHIEEFCHSTFPNFTKQLPSVNLESLEVDNNPKLRHAPEDEQGWCSSISPHYETDIGHGTYEDAIKAIVERGNKWMIVTGGPNVTHNICAVAVDVYEYEDKTPFNMITVE